RGETAPRRLRTRSRATVPEAHLAGRLGQLAESFPEAKEHLVRQSLGPSFGRALEPVRVSEHGEVGRLAISEGRLDGGRDGGWIHARHFGPGGSRSSSTAIYWVSRRRGPSGRWS